ncbi:hypothetical protein DMC47_27090 [Nostoc sp. 3335mG]|nr:hypothetical protein DMC47_27090 [Nostoc sp. 3335mG]
MPIRTIVGRVYTRPVGSFPSVKTAITQPWDAIQQRNLIHISEADPQIIDYCTEPHRGECSTGVEDFIYFPDLIRLRVDGTIEVIEVKNSLDEVDRDPEYKRKLGYFGSIYEQLGWSFKIFDRSEIEREPRLSNARAISLDRATTVTTAHRMSLLEALQDGGGTIGFGEAVASLSEQANPECATGRARLHALIVKRFIEIDINKPITLFSPIRLAEPSQLSLAQVVSRHLNTEPNQESDQNA